MSPKFIKLCILLLSSSAPLIILKSLYSCLCVSVASTGWTVVAKEACV